MKMAVYGIFNKTQNKWYVGSTTNLHKRMITHKAVIKSGKIGKYEIDKNDEIEFVILKEVDKIKNLEPYENYYIGLKNSIENGYNKILGYRVPTFYHTFDNNKRTSKDFTSIKKLIEDLGITKQEFKKIRDLLPYSEMRGVKFYCKEDVIDFILSNEEIKEYIKPDEMIAFKDEDIEKIKVY